jgi:hypothetical protein
MIIADQFSDGTELLTQCRRGYRKEIEYNYTFIFL